MAKKITLTKVEFAEFGLRELLDSEDVDPLRRAELERSLALVTSLRPTPAAGTHTPVAYDRGIIGCSCGFRPDHPAARISTMLGAYHSHLAKLGLPRTSAPVIYGYGPNVGKPWG